MPLAEHMGWTEKQLLEENTTDYLYMMVREINHKNKENGNR